MINDGPSRKSLAIDVAEFLSAAYSCSMRMFENATYVEAELPKVELPQRLRKEVYRVCATWISNKHDISGELDDFHDTPAPLESELKQGRVERISRWLSEDFPQLNELVVKLRDLSEQNPKYIPAHMLVTESAVNVLRSFAEVRAAADRYFSAVGASGSN